MSHFVGLVLLTVDDDADGGGGETVKFVGSGQISIKTKVNS